ncbi:MAG TPA: hypothetical protein DCE78_06095, partial [Bacteroidetes bacterium]|nr:hypothetical protein [Bacteroidota bacterium]
STEQRMRQQKLFAEKWSALIVLRVLCSLYEDCIGLPLVIRASILLNRDIQFTHYDRDVQK